MSIVFTFGFLELECEYQNDLSQTRNSNKGKHTHQLNDSLFIQVKPRVGYDKNPQLSS